MVCEQACEALLRCLPSADGLTEAGPDGVAPLWEADAVLASRVQFLASMLGPCVPRLAQVPALLCCITLPIGAVVLPTMSYSPWLLLVNQEDRTLCCMPAAHVAATVTRHHSSPWMHGSRCPLYSTEHSRRHRALAPGARPQPFLDCMLAMHALRSARCWSAPAPWRCCTCCTRTPPLHPPRTSSSAPCFDMSTQ